MLLRGPYFTSPDENRMKHVGDVVAARQYIRQHVQIARAMRECLVDISVALREDRRCLQGVSTRSLVQAIPALQTLAMLRGRDFVAPEDIEHLAVPLFQHRIALIPGVSSAEEVVHSVIKGPLEQLSRSTLKR